MTSILQYYRKIPIVHYVAIQLIAKRRIPSWTNINSWYVEIITVASAIWNHLTSPTEKKDVQSCASRKCNAGKSLRKLNRRRLQPLSNSFGDVEGKPCFILQTEMYCVRSRVFELESASYACSSIDQIYKLRSNYYH